jgi:hypothetical protein
MTKRMRSEDKQYFNTLFSRDTCGIESLFDAISIFLTTKNITVSCKDLKKSILLTAENIPEDICKVLSAVYRINIFWFTAEGNGEPYKYNYYYNGYINKNPDKKFVCPDLGSLKSLNCVSIAKFENSFRLITTSTTTSYYIEVENTKRYLWRRYTTPELTPLCVDLPPRDESPSLSLPLPSTPRDLLSRAVGFAPVPAPAPALSQSHITTMLDLHIATYKKLLESSDATAEPHIKRIVSSLYTYRGHCTV